MSTVLIHFIVVKRPGIVSYSTTNFQLLILYSKVVDFANFTERITETVSASVSVEYDRVCVCICRVRPCLRLYL